MLLNCHTYYSFKYGALSVEEFLKEVSSGGYSTVALTDINNTSACIEFTRRADEFNIHPVIGIDFRNGVQQQFVGIARNNEGFRELNEFLSSHLHEKMDFDPVAPNFKNAFVIYPFSSSDKKLKENEFLGVSPEDLKKLPFTKWKNDQGKLVILQSSTFRNKKDYNLHRLLRAIDNNTLLSKLPDSEQASPGDIYLTKTELLVIYSEFPEIIKNTGQLLNKCSLDFHFGENKNKRFYTGSDEEDFKLLKKECLKGLKYRYKNPDKQVLERLDKELKVIKELNFCSYFLINWDLVNYARMNNYFYVGRGSGANSLVAYLLLITNVDPIELDLYFERFINPYRTSPPDFDIDFSWVDRDDVTRYIFEKYGYDKAVLLGTYITYNHKSAFREIGKVFGLPDEEIVELQKNPDPRQANEYGKWVIQYSSYISGFPSHCSIHASGILITEKPVSYYTATELLPKGFPSTQFDMHIAEDAGLHKFDILSQRGLGKIKDSLEIIKENKGIEIDINDVKRFKNDSISQNLLRQGKAIGCFYIESPAMRMLLTKLRAGDYKSLVAASSIIRPGVASSGMMREYILRFQDQERREKAKQALPELYKILEDTYGVMVYQEDVIKVAHYFAGLTLDEADVLRRGMSWKFRQRNEFWKVKERFFENCRAKRYKDSTISEIWKQIESFANYAFAKGHSASYAVESFQALFLKAYYPLEYLTATLNNGGGFYGISLYVHEARLHGAQIEAPCVNKSDWLNRIEGKTIYLGIGFLHQLESETGEKLLQERSRAGNFLSLKDFVSRVQISLEQLIILIRIGAFRFTGINKKKLLWDAHYLLGHSKKTKTEPTLFNPEVKDFKLPELWKHELEDAFDEIELLGFPLISPFRILKNENLPGTTSRELPQKINNIVEIVGYLIHRKPTRTNKGEVMYFGTWIDREGQWIDTVHFPPSLKKYPFYGPGCYTIRGKVVDEFGFISIEVDSIERLENRNLDN
ncbi:MAG: DNA polymerase III subunit alpha [Prolixibacteraceae bacterium]|nr:DNA polymerase III subunit alpha [Prolixibacteraceae bacterium]